MPNFRLFSSGRSNRLLILTVFVAGMLLLFAADLGPQARLISGVVWASLLLFLLVWASASIASGVYVEVVTCNREKRDMVSLTFDDGPCETSVEIIDLLEKYNAKASFFLIGSRITGKEAIVRRMIREGHLVGHHSWSHRSSFPLMSPQNIREDILTARSVLENVSGIKHPWFRPPFGVTNPMIAAALKGLNLKIAGWSIRSFDTKNENAELVLKRIVKKLKGGDIVLLHDTSANIVPLLESLLQYLKKKGYRCVNLDTLVS